MKKDDCGSPFAPGRKGYIRFCDIPSELIALLNHGKIETATLTEQASMDFAIVLREALRDWSGDTAALAREVAGQDFSRQGLVKRMELAGRALGESGAFGNAPALQQLTAHPVDTVRGFACFAIALHPGLEFAEKFTAIRPLAADRHFGVREWAWLALRPAVAAAPLDAIALLNGWVSEADANLRRFAVEITRPRGVWAKHIPLLQAEPWRGLPLLEPCRRDAARYVQDSVANWLNDAARSQPDWVEALCREWFGDNSDDKACRYISRRAQRNLNLTKGSSATD
ncbi:MAG: DNA alkylation repair protein [Betaproteobacteria bacterium]|nr:DNA alkylation repair protein [Betaproteobacteria bacterium]